MKANQKFVMDEEAVSPVIAVILMVAITVVLAATVFVLVSDLGGDVGQSSPKMQLVSDSSTKATNWVVKVTDATRGNSLSDYELIHTTPTQGIIVYKVTSTTDFNGGDEEVILSGDVAGNDLLSVDDTTTKGTATDPGYRVAFLDISGDDLFNVLDTVKISYDDTDADGDYDDRLPSGTHKIELRHVPTGAISASMQNSF